MRANRRAGGVVQGSSPCTRLHCAFGAALCLRALPAPRRFAARSVSRRGLAMPPAAGGKKGGGPEKPVRRNRVVG